MKHVPTKSLLNTNTLFLFSSSSSSSSSLQIKIQNAAFHSFIQSLSGDAMAIAAGHQKPTSDASLFSLCWSSGNVQNQTQGNAQKSPKTVSSVARSLLLPPRRRLRLDPSNHLYFPCNHHFLYFSSPFSAFLCS